MEKILVNSYPATKWNEATPLGNGVLGASVYGSIYDERILINHEGLFNYSTSTSLPDVSYALKDVRALLDKGKYKEANDYYTNLIKESGFRGGIGKFYPALDLHMIFQTTVEFEDYSRQLDMERGVCTVSYKENGSIAKRTIFASSVDGVVVVNIKKDTPFDLKFNIERHDLSDCVDGIHGELEIIAQGGYIYSRHKTIGNLDYSCLVKVLQTDGVISSGNDKTRTIGMSGEAKLGEHVGICGATEVTLLLSLERYAKLFYEMRAEMDAISLSYEELLARHVSDFSSLFNKTRLTLTDKKNESIEELMLHSYNGRVDTRLVEKMADFGRYLLISSSYRCSFPANLQGLWNGEYSPAWACTYFNNENIQMAYWQACPGGLEKTLLPLFNLYDSLKEDYRANARRLYGCRGLLLPLFMDNSSGRKENLQPHVLYWTGSSAWISAIYYEYYLFTRDEEFLRSRAYPFMKECALFYEDFLVYDENGKLKSYPSNSPENHPDGDFEGARTLSVCVNATMDFALLKELLTNLIASAKKLGTDEDKIKLWEKMLRCVPEYEINEDGAIKEWLHKDLRDNYHHRHQSHIYPLFPGYEIDETSKELFDALGVAVEKRLSIGIKAQTGWSLAHMANIYARLKDAKNAKRCLELLIRFCTGANLYTYHNDWRNMGVSLKYMHAGKAPFQIDANMGFTSAVYEMLLYSTPSKTRLLSALPDDWESGEITGIRTRNGCEVSIKWEKDTVSASLCALFDTEFKLGAVSCELVSSSMKLSSPDGDGYYAVSLKKGEEIKISYRRLYE